MAHRLFSRLLALNWIHLPGKLACPIDKFVQCIAGFLTRKKVTLKALQSLIGLLNFACSVVTPGGAFLRRLIDLTRGISQPHFFICLNRSVKSYLRIWQTFLSSFDGKSLFFDDHWRNNQKLNLYMDASGAIGFGALFRQEWCYGKLPENWLKYNTVVLEFYPIVPSLCLFAIPMHRFVRWVVGNRTHFLNISAFLLCQLKLGPILLSSGNKLHGGFCPQNICIILIYSVFSTGDRAIFLNDIWLWGSGLLYTAHFLLFMKQSMPLARAVAYILYVGVFWIIIRSPQLFCFRSMIVQSICQFSMDGGGTQFVLLLTSTAILTEVPMYTSIIIFLYLFRV